LVVNASIGSMEVCLLIIDYVLYHTDQGKLEEMVSELSQGLAVIKHEQEYMEVRERIHRMSESVDTLINAHDCN